MENCIAIQFIVLQEKASCREVYCRIVLQEKGYRRVVSQYTGLYCDMRARQGWTVLRYSAQLSHDTTMEARWGAWGSRAHRQAGGQGARGAQQGHAARRAAGPASCALGALGLFLARFDSVLFLSQIFGHCS